MSTEHSVVVIERRYRGPPDSANGGYACGVVGRGLAGSARVRLNLPPPLERPLSLSVTDGDHARLFESERIVAEGSVVPFQCEVPGPIGFDVAAAASEHYRWFSGHPFPGCFVCGPDRERGDGLRIFPGPVADRGIVAAPWVPDESLRDRSGAVPPEVVWAALDCPSWFAILEYEPGTSVALLGQLTARIVRRPAAGERCVVTGWKAGRDGRKLFGGAALHSADGRLLACSQATWIEPPR